MGAPFQMPALADPGDLAQALHARRALEQALDHGTALLAALGLPRLVDDGFVAIDSQALGNALDVVIAHLDTLDAPEEDLEPSLGSSETHTPLTRCVEGRWFSVPADQRNWAEGGVHDHESEITDEPHDGRDDNEEPLGWAANVSQIRLGPNTADGDETAPERHGGGFVRCGRDDAEDDDPGGSEESGIADLDGYHEQCGFVIAGALPWSVGGHVDG